MSVVIRTARGRRDTQQDRVAATPGVALVADGMGGQPGGGQAAQAAVGAALASLAASGSGRRGIEDAIVAAAQAVRQLRLSDPQFAKADTTLTLVSIVELPGSSGPRCAVAHVGDSPAFLLRGQDTTLLTPPHTVAGDLHRSGQLSQEDARTHPTRGTLTRTLGEGPPQPEFSEVDLEPGDRILVTTDGLLDGTGPRKIRELATVSRPLDEIAEGLMAEALAHSKDNVTFALIDPFDDEPDRHTG